MKSLRTLLLALLVPTGLAFADVRLPAIISDHMVLEKSATTPVWGWADAGEDVSVSLGKKYVKTRAGGDGKWRVVLDLSKSKEGPFELKLEGNNTLIVKDVLVGQVWVASGQSNMEWTLKDTLGADEEIAKSENRKIRQFLLERSAATTPADDCKGSWVSASPQTTGNFTAVGYYFAKKLNAELREPVGIIKTAWGGTPVETWTSRTALDSVPDLKAGSAKADSETEAYKAAKAEFQTAYPAWLKQTGREDKPIADLATFAASGLSAEGWTKVNLPGTVAGEGLPEAGAVWLRRTVVVPAGRANKKLPLILGAIDGFDSAYWNGQLLDSTIPENLPGKGFVRRGKGYDVPGDMVKEGENTLAIRVFCPAGPARFAGQMKAGGQLLNGEWLAKKEYALPPLTAAQPPAPRPPAIPLSSAHLPSRLFNGMISPILPCAISGVLWYQGESNATRAEQYRTAFPLMVKDWRDQWKRGDFPFLFCQLANFNPKSDVAGDSNWAELRDAQLASLSLPKTGQAVLIDIGETDDIHPRNKKDVGDRLAKIALAMEHGKKIPFSGPVFASLKIEDAPPASAAGSPTSGSKVARIQFRHTDGGLVARPVPSVQIVKSAENETAPLTRNSPQSQLEGFSICGEDGKWFWANAQIDGSSVVVWSPQVAAPVAVRYGWADNPTCNLYNDAGFPASPFRTDAFPAKTGAAKYGF